MQQPLCQLYFLTVLEHVQRKHSSEGCPQEQNHICSLVRTITSLQTNLETAEEGEAVLLWVELQATVQVLIQLLAENLDPDQSDKLGNFQQVADDINR